MQRFTFFFIYIFDVCKRYAKFSGDFDSAYFDNFAKLIHIKIWVNVKNLTNKNKMTTKNYIKIVPALLLAIFFALASFSGCEKTQIEPATNYPYNIGSKWTYSVYDSILQIGYTETVEITGTIQLSNGLSAKVFKSTFSSNEDSVAYLYLTENTDSLTFWAESWDAYGDYYYKIKVYVTPVNIGSQWVGVNNVDTVRVVSNENIKVPAGNFNTFKVIRRYSLAGNYSFSENEWYSASIGMIRRDYFSRNLGWPENKSYQLISYQLK